MIKIINTTMTHKQMRHKNFAAMTLAALIVSTFGLSLSFSNSAFAAEQVCSTITLASGTTTQTAGFTETNPVAHPLTIASYAHTYDLATSTATFIPPWIDPLVSAVFSVGASKWVSSATTSPGATGNTEGLASAEQWRLFQDSFTIPANATVTAADIWYTADNAAAVFSNATFTARTGAAVDDVFGLVPTDKPAVYANVYHTTFSPIVGTNTINFVVRNWGGALTSNPTGLLYKAVVNYCTTSVTPPNTIGNLMVKKMVIGGTATSADFQIHVMKSGVEVTGSPKAGTATGTTYAGLATSSTAYVVSETGGPVNYTMAMTGDCDTSGNVMINGSTTKTCTLTNTFVTGTTTPPVTGDAPRLIKQGVLNDLIALRETMSDRPGSDIKWVNRAIAHLQAALSPRLWVDNDTINDQRGDKVFDLEQLAADSLMKLMKSKKNDVSDVTLQSYIDKLVLADRILAQTAITDSANNGRNPQRLARAVVFITRADTAIANGNILNGMWRYQKAWGLAITAR